MTVGNLFFHKLPSPIYGLCMGQSCPRCTTIQNFNRTCPFPFSMIDVELLLYTRMIRVDKGRGTITEPPLTFSMASVSAITNWDHFAGQIRATRTKLSVLRLSLPATAPTGDARFVHLHVCWCTIRQLAKSNGLLKLFSMR